MTRDTSEVHLKYPVIMDNDYKIWHAYHNEYWPTLYLIDKKGDIRYTHIGKGAYDEIDRTIAQLLAEPNQRRELGPRRRVSGPGIQTATCSVTEPTERVASLQRLCGLKRCRASSPRTAPW